MVPTGLSLLQCDWLGSGLMNHKYSQNKTNKKRKDISLRSFFKKKYLSMESPVLEGDAQTKDEDKEALLGSAEIESTSPKIVDEEAVAGNPEQKEALVALLEDEKVFGVQSLMTCSYADSR